ncbi:MULTISPECIES: hypothetical protein [unclassified Streptomyces]|uniref:hypothetical protein n=1 Tax=unclassified Streptomyces TaxID=2593676 RepID=UPI002E3445FE|nr:MULTISPECIES: hypothetical protein [unclassified Streptomyces]WUC68931.1 hypothetical protein OG861_14760 [Streptomyces sp. NBC_00539]
MDPHTKAILSTPLARDRGEPAHTTSTAERGAFCLAVCSCGWTGPARRSRDLARRDAGRHPAG